MIWGFETGVEGRKGCRARMSGPVTQEDGTYGARVRQGAALRGVSWGVRTYCMSVGEGARQG